MTFLTIQLVGAQPALEVSRNGKRITAVFDMKIADALAVVKNWAAFTAGSPGSCQIPGESVATTLRLPPVA